MKRFRKLICLILSITMLLSGNIVVFAEDGDGGTGGTEITGGSLLPIDSSNPVNCGPRVIVTVTEISNQTGKIEQDDIAKHNQTNTYPKWDECLASMEIRQSRPIRKAFRFSHWSVLTD